jgi:adenosylcobyric acid synthase
MEKNVIDEPVHGGNIREISERTGIPEKNLVDFSANINPIGPPSWLKETLVEELPHLTHYPDRSVTALIDAISESYGIPAQRIVAGNGTTELFFTLPRAAKYKRLIVPVPSYGDYSYANRIAGIDVVEHPLLEENGFLPDFQSIEKGLKKSGSDTAVVLAFPNNPTGLLFDRDRFRRLVHAYPDVLFCVDEAFADFLPQGLSFLSESAENLLVFRSFTKFFAIPGLRLGWLSCSDPLAKSIRSKLPTWSVNALAEAVGTRACRDREYAERTIGYVEKTREELVAALEEVDGLYVYPGEANFLFIRIEGSQHSASDLYRHLLKEGIIIRLCKSYSGLDDRFFRIAVRTEKENEQLIRGIRSFFLNAGAPVDEGSGTGAGGNGADDAPS